MALSKREQDKKKERRRVSAEAWSKEPERGGPNHIKLPDGVTMFKLEAGKRQLLDFMCFNAGAGNRRADEGSPHYETEYEMHWVPTGNGKGTGIICAWSRWQEKCAVCQWMNRYGGTADPDLIKGMRPKPRQLFLVKDVGTKDKKFQVFDAGFYNRGMGFGEQLKDAVARHKFFADPVDGETLELTVKEQSMGSGNKYPAVTRIDFVDREEAYDDSIIDEAPCLDDMLTPPVYDDVWKLLQQGETGDSEEDTGNSSSNGHKDKDTEEEEEPKTKAKLRGKSKASKVKDGEGNPITVGDLVTYKGNECEIKSITDDGLLLETEDDETFEDVDPDRVELVPTKDQETEEEEEEEEPKTKTKGKTPPPKKGKPADYEEDEDEPDPEDSSDLEEDKDDFDSDDEDEEADEDEPDEDDDPPPAKKKSTGKKK